MSAHADANEILRWLRTFPKAPGITYLVHGEPPAQVALKARIERELGWNVHIPAYGRKLWSAYEAVHSSQLKFTSGS